MPSVVICQTTALHRAYTAACAHENAGHWVSVLQPSGCACVYTCSHLQEVQIELYRVAKSGDSAEVSEGH